MEEVETTKALTINGSPREKGNTAGMLSAAEEELRRAGIEVERVSLANVDIRPCTACEACHKSEWSCPIEDDAIRVLKKMVEADAILIGSPVYFGGVTAQLKALFDRSAIPYQGSELRDKIGGALSCGGARQGGQEMTVTQIIVFFMTHDMQVANTGDGAYGAMGVADGEGDIADDEEGLSSARNLGQRTAQLLTRSKA
ncbi:MAG: flavodoxin family protein [Methanobacteriota archaeon]|nr:MAG: flavodoxin family protein [Euryarchaeota archaeon]